MLIIPSKQLVEKVNEELCYQGTWPCSAELERNRIPFVREIRGKYEQRNDILRIEKQLWGFEDQCENSRFISIWDYYPRGESQNIHEVRIDWGKQKRLTFPKEIILPGNNLVYIGAGGFFEIWNQEEWRELQMNLKDEELFEKDFLPCN